MDTDEHGFWILIVAMFRYSYEVRHDGLGKYRPRRQALSGTGSAAGIGQVERVSELKAKSGTEIETEQ
jgi:hypothetical protein